ncbi:hypothetical protein [Brevundimonas sp.]|uniref:hypothetical protein n=1 Tax=Brevundimonas sp. TaxID=1871086 RepID=UPI003A8D3E49
MSRQSIGETVSRRLHKSESTLDTALHEMARLAAFLPQARARAGLSAVTGQKVFDETAAAIGALTEARAHLVRTHVTLAALARQLGLDTVAVGPLDKPDDRPPVGGNILTLPENRATPIINKTLPRNAGAC